MPPLIGWGIAIAGFASISDSDPELLRWVKIMMSVFVTGMALAATAWSIRRMSPEPPAAKPAMGHKAAAAAALAAGATAAAASQAQRDTNESWGTGGIGSDMRTGYDGAGGGYDPGGGYDSGGDSGGSDSGGGDSGGGYDSGGGWS